MKNSSLYLPPNTISSNARNLLVSQSRVLEQLQSLPKDVVYHTRDSRSIVYLKVMKRIY